MRLLFDEQLAEDLCDLLRDAVLRGAPPKVVWIRLGNCTTAEIAALLLNSRRDVC